MLAKIAITAVVSSLVTVGAMYAYANYQNKKYNGGLEHVALSSTRLPNDLELSIEHRLDWELTEPGTQFDYSFLIYTFSKKEEVIATARMYIDSAREVSVFLPEGRKLADPAVRDCFLTLYTYSFGNVQFFDRDGGGYRTVDPSELDIDEDDVLRWARQMNKAT